MKKVIDYSLALDVHMFEDNLFLAFPKTENASSPYFTFGSGPPQFHLNIDYARALGIAIAQAISGYDIKRAKVVVDKIDDLGKQAHRALDSLTPVVEPIPPYVGGGKADDDIPF